MDIGSQLPSETAEEGWYNLVGPNFSIYPEFSFVQGNPDLPNVLIYGDSISIGHTMQVRRKLKGKANIYRIYNNGLGSAPFIPKMTMMHQIMRDKGRLKGTDPFLNSLI